MKYFILAGEASGDLHGSRLIQSFLDQDPETEFAYWGGDKMEAVYPAGLKKHIHEMGFMGFIEVLKHIRVILKQFKEVHEHILKFKPDALILIDYPGFNLRLAKWAHEQSIPVYYYIAPQVWAWKAKRVEKIKKYVDKLFVILPFEKQWFSEREAEVEFIGHPLMPIISEYKSTALKRESNEKKLIAFLPGSRKMEVQKMLPRMLKMTKHFPNYKFAIAGRKDLGLDFYKSIVQQAFKDEKLTFEHLKSWNSHGLNSTFGCYSFAGNCILVFDQTYDILNTAHAALVTSGTATLETALFNVPEVVCYAGSPISFELAKRLVKVPYISLVNLIANKEVVKELIQSDLNEKNLTSQLQEILEGSRRIQILKDYDEIRSKLKVGKENPSAIAARMISEGLGDRNS